MFRFLRLLDLCCASVAIAVVNLSFPQFFFVSSFGAHIGLINVWTFASSGFVLCVSGHN